MIMSNSERDFFLRVINDDPRVMPIAHQISKYKNSLDITVWLIKNKITGIILLDFLKSKFENSILDMVKFIIMKINKDKEPKPIYAHKDYKV